MIRIVPDTNVLVSALWSQNGNAKNILDRITRGELRPCYDFRIIAEYEDVLNRPKFMFSVKDINKLLNGIKTNGLCTVAQACGRIFIDETDRAFYEVAAACGAYLITGNAKHFPKEPFILSPADFLRMISPT